MSTQMTSLNEDVRTIGELARGLKDDVNEFLQTRMQLLRTEMSEKMAAVKAAVPAIGIAVVLGMTGFLALSAALAYLIGLFIGFGWAMLVVGVGYFVIAGIAAAAGTSKLRKDGLAPKKTIEILNEDKNWAQQEARAA